VGRLDQEAERRSRTSERACAKRAMISAVNRIHQGRATSIGVRPDARMHQIPRSRDRHMSRPAATLADTTIRPYHRRTIRVDRASARNGMPYLSCLTMWCERRPSRSESFLSEEIRAI